MSSFNNIKMILDKEKTYLEKLIHKKIYTLGGIFGSNSSDIITSEADTSQYDQEEVHKNNDDLIMENKTPKDSTSKNNQDNLNNTHI